MNIVFTPRRARRNAASADFSVRIRRYRSAMCLEATISAKVQSQLRYLDGDRIHSEFDPENKVWYLTRVSPDKIEDGYKVSVRACSKKSEGHTFVSFRIGAEPDQLTKVLGGREKAEYDLLEVSGNKAVFVERE